MVAVLPVKGRNCLEKKSFDLFPEGGSVSTASHEEHGGYPAQEYFRVEVANRR